MGVLSSTIFICEIISDAVKHLNFPVNLGIGSQLQKKKKPMKHNANLAGDFGNFYLNYFATVDQDGITMLLGNTKSTDSTGKPQLHSERVCLVSLIK